jgi:hypothetical protein
VVEATAKLVFESFGLVIEVGCDDPELLEACSDVLPPGWKPVDTVPTTRFDVRACGEIWIDGNKRHLGSSRSMLRLQLGSLLRSHLATRAPNWVFVHAGVVGVDGVGVMVPGASRSGKSTLVAELVRRGATYYSDEYAVVSRDTTIHPFAKPLSIRSQLEALGHLVAPPKDQVATAPIICGAIVVTRYRNGAEWRPEIRSSGEGALAVLGNILSARLRPDAALRAARQIADGALVLVGERGDARQAADELLVQLDARVRR